MSTWLRRPGGQRLVHQQELRIENQSASQGGALPLSGRELRRLPVEQSRDIECFSQRIHTHRSVVVLRQPEGNVLADGEVRKECLRLQHVPHARVDVSVHRWSSMYRRVCARRAGSYPSSGCRIRRCSRAASSCLPRKLRTGCESPERIRDRHPSAKPLANLLRSCALSASVHRQGQITHLLRFSPYTSESMKKRRRADSNAVWLADTVVERLHRIVDCDRDGLRLSGYVAADHQYYPELAEGMGEGQHDPGNDRVFRERQYDLPEDAIGEAPSVAAARRKERSTAAKPAAIGCTAKGRLYSTEPTHQTFESERQGVPGDVLIPAAERTQRPDRDQDVESEHGGRQHQRQSNDDSTRNFQRARENAIHAASGRLTTSRTALTIRDSFKREEEGGPGHGWIVYRVPPILNSSGLTAEACSLFSWSLVSYEAMPSSSHS